MKCLISIIALLALNANAVCQPVDEIIGHVECHASLGKYLDKPIIDYTNFENGNTEVTFTNGSTCCIQLNAF